MPLIGGDALYRLTDYLDRQAVREKEKRTEKFLTVLPTYLQKQISGITDEKTLFSTIPKLSAQMYAFGPQVGQAANQILGNLADVKYKEISYGKQEKQYQDINKVYKEITSGVPGVGSAVEGILGRSDISEEIKSKMLPAVMEMSKVSETGLGINEGGKYFYQSYTVGPKGTKPGERYELKKGKSGYGMDKTSTTDTEELPLTMEAMKYLEGELSWQQKLDAQLRKQMSLQESSQNRMIEKQKNALIDQAKKMLFKDRSTGEIVRTGYDKEKEQLFYYKEKKPEDVYAAVYGDQAMTKDGRIVDLPKSGFIEERLTDVSNLEQIGQGFQTDKGIIATDVDQAKQNANTLLMEYGDYLTVQKGIDAKNVQNDLDPKYYSYEKVIKELRDAGENEKANKLEQYKQQAGGVMDAYSGFNKPTTQKPLGKW